MALVVEQTIPFSPQSLDLHNPSKWNHLLPLIRPTIKAVLTPKGQPILIDTSLFQSKFLRVAAVGRAGNFSSKLLDDRNVTAIVTEQAGAGLLTAQDIRHALHSSGMPIGQGLVVVRAGKRTRVEVHDSDVLEIETESELQQDHVIHLLAHATDSCRASIHHTGDMLKGFVKTVSASYSKFHTEKAEGNPVVLHVDGAAGFESARHAAERDLRHVLSQVNKSQTAETKDVVYSVHFADVNGLSRLENYILAGEIVNYLESQNVPYSLSHSTILDEKERGRGWAISISPISSYYLSQQAKPEAHQSTSTGDEEVLERSLTLTNSIMIFDDADVRKRIESGCNALIKEERTITEYDTIVGDADCGYTLRDGAKKALSFINGKDLSKLPEVLAKLVKELEVSMGGTSGALYCIYLTALARALALENTIPNALKAALEQLYTYTNARVGDRTMMDVLIPFTEIFAETGDTTKALEEAKRRVESTKTMRAMLGRSAYLDDKATQGVPDPGAYGMYVLLNGLSNA